MMYANAVQCAIDIVEKSNIRYSKELYEPSQALKSTISSQQRVKEQILIIASNGKDAVNAGASHQIIIAYFEDIIKLSSGEET